MIGCDRLQQVLRWPRLSCAYACYFCRDSLKTSRRLSKKSDLVQQNQKANLYKTEKKKTEQQGQQTKTPGDGLYTTLSRVSSLEVAPQQLGGFSEGSTSRKGGTFFCLQLASSLRECDKLKTAQASRCYRPHKFHSLVSSLQVESKLPKRRSGWIFWPISLGIIYRQMV